MKKYLEGDTWTGVGRHAGHTLLAVETLTWVKEGGLEEIVVVKCSCGGSWSETNEQE